MNILGEIWLVYHKGSTTVRYASLSRDDAEYQMRKLCESYPDLDWKTANIEEYGQDCYDSGSDPFNGLLNL